VANAGPSTATAIQVTDTPANLSITAVSGACAALPCTIATLASGANTTINVAATIIAPGAFDNSATATPAETDINTTNNTDNSGNGGTTGPGVDVSIVKTLLTAGSFTVGQTITYSLFMTNAGPSTATNIQVADAPSNMTIGAVSGACAALPCTIGSLASGASATITISATINAAGVFDNVASAMPFETDLNPADNIDNAGNGGFAPEPVLVTVDLDVTKTASSSMVFAGQVFDYTVTVTNLGPSTATVVTLTDPLPANFALQSATATMGTCSGTTIVTCVIGTLFMGQTSTITLRGTATATGSLSNTATATALETETILANNSATSSPLMGNVVGTPTLEETGLLILAVLLGAAGALVLKMRA
jgi:uncharacterized repeat protein (TIGR01451 family)